MSFAYKTIEEALALCREKSAKLGLNMTVTGAAYNDDKTRLTFEFTASERIGFRPLLKELAQETGCMLEFRQIKAE